MGSIGLWIIGLAVFCGGAVLAAILIPKSYLQSPVVGMLGLVAIGVIFPLIHKIFKRKETPFRRIRGKLATSNAPLWSGLTMVIVSFVWLFVGLGVVGATSTSPAIVFVPFVGLVTVGSLLISFRTVTWIYRLTGGKGMPDGK